MTDQRYTVVINVENQAQLMRLNADLTQAGKASDAASYGTQRLNAALSKMSQQSGGVSQGVQNTNRAMQQMQQASERTTRAVARASLTQTKYNESLSALQKATTLIAGPLSGVGARVSTINSVVASGSQNLAVMATSFAAVLFSMTAFLREGEKLQLLQNRLRQVTDSQAELAAVTGKLFEISNRSRVDINATVDTYFRLARSVDQTVVSQGKLLVMTETINKAVALSGTTAQSAAAALFQFGQGLAADALRGQELNSVLEQTPRLAQLIADNIEGVNGNLGKLRQLAREGGLETQVVLAAISKGMAQIDEEFERMIPTLGQSIQMLRNSFTEVIGGATQASGVVQVLSGAVRLLADNLGMVLNILAGGGLIYVLSRTLIPTLALFGVQLSTVGVALKSLVTSLVAYRAASATVIKSDAALLAGQTTMATTLSTVATRNRAAAAAVTALATAKSALLSILVTGGLVAAIAGVAYWFSRATTAAEQLREAQDKASEAAITSEAYYERAAAAVGELRDKYVEAAKAASTLAIADLQLRRQKIDETISGDESKLARAQSAFSVLSDSMESALSPRDIELRQAAITLDKQKLADLDKQIEAQKTLAERINDVANADNKRMMSQNRLDEEAKKVAAAELANKTSLQRAADALNEAQEYRKSLDRDYAGDLEEAISLADRLVAARQKAYDTALERDSARASKLAAKEAKDFAKSIEVLNSALSDASPFEKRRVALEKLAEFEKTYANDLKRIDPDGTFRTLMRERIEAQLEQDLKSAEKMADAYGKAFEKAAEGIQQTFTDMFEQIFDKGVISFKSLGASIKKIFTSTLAQMATLAIARPVIVPIIQGVGGMMGMGSSVVNGVTSQFGVPTTGAAGEGFSSLSMAGISNLGFSNTLAGVGNRVTGFFGGTGGLQYGPQVAGQAGNTMLGNALGNSPWGIVGSMGANMMGFSGSGNMAIDMGMGVAGSVGGAALGGMMGSFGGPLGAIAGAAIGQIIASSFAKKPSDRMQSATADLFTGAAGYDAANSFQGKKFSQENADMATSLAQMAAAVGRALGGMEQTLRVTIGSRDGLRMQLGEGAQRSFGNIGDLSQAIVAALFDEAGIEGEIRAAVDRLDFSDLQRALEDLDFILAFRNLRFANDNLSEFDRQMIAFNEQVDNAIRKARELGLNEEKIANVRDRTIQAMRTDFSTSLDRQMLERTNPIAAQLAALQDQYKPLISNAMTARTGLVKIEQMYYLDREKLLTEYLERENDTVRKAFETRLIDIQKIRDSIDLNRDLSVGNRFTVATAAQEQFDRLADRIRGGDDTAFSDLDSTINAYLRASLDYFGPSTQYLENLDAVRDLLNFAEGQQRTELDLLGDILDANQLANQLLAVIGDMFEKGLGSASGMFQGGGIEADKMLRANESAAILNMINGVTGLTNALDRELKIRASGGAFDFQTTQGSFADFVKAGNKSAGEAFLALLAARGVPQGTIDDQKKLFGFAGGSGGAGIQGRYMAGENGAEIIETKRPTMVYSNGESRAITGMEAFNSELRLYRKQSEEETRRTIEVLEEIEARLGRIEEDKALASRVG